jgi:hypothetical protein
MSKSENKTRQKIIEAGKVAVNELISVAKEKILSVNTESNSDDQTEKQKEISADRMKTAAQAKKVAVFDAFEILDRIEQEQNALDEMNKKDSGEMAQKVNSSSGFAERNAHKKRD